MTVAILGNLSLDEVGGGPPRPGGAVYYGAIAAHRLGITACVAARCAERDREIALGPLQSVGVPVVWGAAAETTRFSFRYEGEHRVMEVDAVGDPWTPADVGGWAAEALEDADWVHVGALLRSDFPVDALHAIARGGRRLLLDAQGLVRPACTGPLRADADVSHDVLGPVHVLKLSEGEAMLLAGSLDPPQLRRLGVPEVVVTRGAAGSMVVTPDTEHRVEAVRLSTADPTGAGDVYATGYIAARSGGADPVEAARAAGALVTEILRERR